ncbi:MAG: phosphoribosylamine--glycine ligase [Nitrospinota bacterium]|nr:phosphoribosylamine--glycine ligase [Nitrospinota bacterium]
MNILVIGSGGREHALVWKIKQSRKAGKVFCAPGNAGTAQLAQNVPIPVDDMEGLARFAKENLVALTVVGPEVPLCEGIVDLFHEMGLTVFGPSKAAAQLEGSKDFMKNVVNSAGAPTAAYETHTVRDEAIDALGHFPNGVVVKADGLAAGKGVVVCDTKEEAVAAIDRMMGQMEFGAAGATVVLEEKLVGEEASVLVFCDGERYHMMPAAQDHKRIGDGDAGPNTGGMGAYSPAPVVTPGILANIESHIIKPVIKTMHDMGAPYRGVLYAGIMITAEGPKVLEFNCRFGDPECQPVMMRLKSDIVPLLTGCAKGALPVEPPEWDPRASVCVVMAAGGYPGSYQKGETISGLDQAAAMKDVVVFHAGTKLDGQNVVTSGGRVLGVTSLGDSVASAVKLAYRAVSEITWDGAVYRTDIAKRALSR